MQIAEEGEREEGAERALGQEQWRLSRESPREKNYRVAEWGVQIAHPAAVSKQITKTTSE